MAGKTKVLLPPSPEARAEVLAHVRASARPLSAGELAKLLCTEHKTPAAAVAVALQELVATGTLHELPGKSPKSKPLYWDRDPRAVCLAAAIETVLQAESPLTAKELLRRLAVPLKVRESELSAMLEAAVHDGKLHRIPPATARGKPRYWNCDALAYGRLEILRTLREKGPQSETNLKKAARGLSEIEIRQIIQDGLAAGELWRHPPFGKTKKELIGSQPPSPDPYFAGVRDELAKVVTKLSTAGVGPDDLRRALVRTIEAAGVSFGAAAGSVRSPAPAPVKVDLVALMRRIEPGADRGTLVGARDLRRAAKLEKQPFDGAVLELARQGQLSLHRHDFAASLTPAERDELVTDGAGTFYVGMALRNGAR